LLTNLTEPEIIELKSNLPYWNFTNGALERDYIFNSFFEALSFVVKVGMIAEKVEHHPDIHLFSYSHVSIKTFTSETNGITSKDFELINQIERI